MIRLRHAILLSRTKLHSKRGMLFISTTISSILFTALMACIIVFSGVQESANTFISEANNGEYLVEVNPVIPESVMNYSMPLSLDDIHRINKLEDNYYKNLRQQYKQIGLTYDNSREEHALKPSAYLPSTLPVEQRVEVNYQSPIIELDRLIKMDAYVKSAKNTLQDLKTIGEKYGASGYYSSEPLGISGIPNLLLVQNNKENFEDLSIKAGDLSTYGYYTNAIHNGNYEFVDNHLLKRYLLPSVTKNLKGIPVIVSAQEAMALFGEDKELGKEPKDPQQKAEWFKSAQSLFNGYTYKVCYRNSTEMSKIEKVQRLLTFQIVGLVNAEPYSKYTDNIQSYIQNLLSVDSSSFSAVIPRQSYESLDDSLKINNSAEVDQPSKNPLRDAGLTTHILSFKTIQDARRFISQETCPSSDTGCQKLFTSNPYGSNYLILDQISIVFKKIMLIAVPVVLGLALLIMWLTVTRVMAESRKEIAVYRAMGATSLDISKIYLIYVLTIGLRIALIASILGVGAAYGINLAYSPQLTSTATSVFGNMTEKTTFNLFSLESPYISFIILAIVTISIAASLQPLVRNLRRSPIDDIRNE